VRAACADRSSENRSLLSQILSKEQRGYIDWVMVRGQIRRARNISRDISRLVEVMIRTRRLCIESRSLAGS
jgi:hypothetical protein